MMSTLMIQLRANVNLLLVASLLFCNLLSLLSYDVRFTKKQANRFFCHSYTLPARIVDHVDEIVGWDEYIKRKFITEYFQVKPLLIRNAFSYGEVQLGISQNDFISFCKEDDVESRLFTLRRGKPIKDYGPFKSKRLASALKKPGSSILIQELDRHIPSAADLWNKHFNFIPNWRRDDIMISLSSVNGSIGGHVDNYDVFLIQGIGRRSWSIENKFLTEREEDERAVENSSTKLLRDFHSDQCWELQPGDMLYLPPRIPHQGVTTSKSVAVTISVGFRAPNFKSLTTALLGHICSQIPTENAFYHDNHNHSNNDISSIPYAISTAATVGNSCTSGDGPGKIADDAVHSIRTTIESMILGTTQADSSFKHWLGSHLTEPVRFRLRPPQPFFLRNLHSIGANTSSIAEHEMHTKIGCDCVDGQRPSVEHSKNNFLQSSVVSSVRTNNDLPYAVRGKFSVALDASFDNASAVIDAVVSDKCALRRAEGLRVAHIDDKLFIDGEAYELPVHMEGACASAVCNHNILLPAVLRGLLKVGSPLSQETDNMRRFWSSMLEFGFYYPVQPKIE